MNLFQTFLRMETLEKQTQLPVQSRHIELAIDRDSDPRPLVHTLWCGGSGVYDFVRCLVHRFTADSADRETSAVSRTQSGSLFPEPHGRSLLADYILNSEFIPVSTLKSHFSFSVCAFLPFHIFPHASQASLLWSQ